MTERDSFFTKWERVIKRIPIRPRAPTFTMEQDDEIAALAAEIYKGWIRDERFLNGPPAHFWAELAARTVREKLSEIEPV